MTLAGFYLRPAARCRQQYSAVGAHRAHPLRPLAVDLVVWAGPTDIVSAGECKLYNGRHYLKLALAALAQAERFPALRFDALQSGFLIGGWVVGVCLAGTFISGTSRT